MTQSIDYFLSLQSPWTYLGHNRLVETARQAGAELSIYPVDYGEVFPATGGLPLPKRAPARQAYRMMELKRWREYLDLPLVLEPAFFPADDKLAAQLVIAQRRSDQGKAVELAGRVLQAVWVEEKNIADPKVLQDLMQLLELDADALLAEAQTGELREVIAEDTKTAISRGVFGAPSYVIGDEVFWGQDRLEFVQRKLAN